jgi:hypothetical protein
MLPASERRFPDHAVLGLPRAKHYIKEGAPD